jgi:prophage antirepressor-like protein
MGVIAFQSDIFGKVRVGLSKDNVWVAITDLGKALKLKTPHYIAQLVKKDMKDAIKKEPSETSSGRQSLSFVHSSGISAFINKSKLTNKEEFVSWLRKQIHNLKQIKKLNEPENIKQNKKTIEVEAPEKETVNENIDSIEELLKQFEAQKQKIQKLEKTLTQVNTKIDNLLEFNGDSVTFTITAKINKKES